MDQQTYIPIIDTTMAIICNPIMTAFPAIEAILLI
jgi:hypothetical protein